jgi:post-segregation antitoxin (ccd killing protein)
LRVFTVSVVISVRIPRKLKEELEKLGVNYSAAIREFLEELVRREKARRLREELERFRRSVGRVEGNLAAEFIREDRNAR